MNEKLTLLVLIISSFFSLRTMDFSLAKSDYEKVITIAKYSSNFFSDHQQELKAASVPQKGALKIFKENKKYYNNFISRLENIKSEDPFNFYIFVPAFSKKYRSDFGVCLYLIPRRSEFFNDYYTNLESLAVIDLRADQAFQDLINYFTLKKVIEENSKKQSTHYPKPLRC